MFRLFESREESGKEQEPGVWELRISAPHSVFSVVDLLWDREELVPIVHTLRRLVLQDK